MLVSCTATSIAAAEPSPARPGFFVSPSGNDRNAGTLEAPFLTLAQAQRAMKNSATKVTYVERGTYRLGATLRLSADDSGETWQYYPPHGVNSAVLDGDGSVDPIEIAGGSNITIDGLKLQRFPAYGISVRNAGHVTVANCDVGFNMVTSWQSAGIYFFGNVPNSLIANNYVHDVGSQGIALFDNWSGAGGPGNIDGSVIRNNVVLRAVQRMSDGGAIYMEEHGGSTTSHVTIHNNFVRDYGAPGVSGQAGIYLDQGSNNVTITGNVVGPAARGSVGTGNAGAFAFQDSTGFNNVFKGNVVDLGDSGRTWIVDFWYETSSGPQHPTHNNVFAGNIILSGFTGTQRTNFTGVRGVSYFQHPRYPTPPIIRDNVYFNYAGGQLHGDGNITGESHPIGQDPQIKGWLYEIARGSPVFGSPVNFAPISGGWGPPGFVIPQGTPPSSPH
jgi:hypothetical protein